MSLETARRTARNIPSARKSLEPVWNAVGRVFEPRGVKGRGAHSTSVFRRQLPLLALVPLPNRDPARHVLLGEVVQVLVAVQSHRSHPLRRDVLHGDERV